MLTNPLHRPYLFVIIYAALFFEKNNDNKRRKKRGIDYEEEIDCRFTGRCDGSISIRLWCIKDRRGSGAGDSAAEETAEAEPVTLNVFAAASMTETLTEIQEMYKEVAPNVTLVFNFDSSGTLKTQIQEGADCDLFISAAQKQMNQLDKVRSGSEHRRA